MKKEWGYRNLELCQHIIAKGTHDDWAITTAFYSAIHFVDYRLFPIQDTEGNIQFSDLFSAKHSLKISTPHEVRKRLVNLYLNEISGSFNYLYDSSKFARYTNYNVSKKRLERCQKNLNRIINFCESK
jgi:hypothetical protein